MSAIGGLTYFAESGLPAELIVDLIVIIIAIACFLMAFTPGWVSANLRVKLDKTGVFVVLLVAFVILTFVVGTLGPVPPGGWWNY